MTTALSHLQPFLEANARLIEAAPVLKEKLLYALERLETYDPDYYRSPFVADCDDLMKVIEGDA